MIAALFVEPAPGGVYQGLPNVDPWDVQRDARKYDGEYPVVAHPPCERWGAFWMGSPLNPTKKLGDDDGCFWSAILSVVRCGGVIEHPAYSLAWKRFGITRPGGSGWRRCKKFADGWVCHVEQGNYGHRAPKATWLFAVSHLPPQELIWGKSPATGRVCGGHRYIRGTGQSMPKKERRQTPVAFRDALLEIAEFCR